MKVGIMLRHAGERGGIAVYTTQVLKNLFKLDRENEYVLIYRRSDQLGRFAGLPNVTEKFVNAPNKLWWDQVSTPRLARKEGLDLIYNPKLSIPLLTWCKTVLVMHADQFATAHAFKWSDRLYFTIANRLYCKRANAIIALTNTGASDIARYMGADPERIHVIYGAYNEHCRVLKKDRISESRSKYSLPERFILYVGGIDPTKNIGNLLTAYAKIRKSFPHKLVFVGFNRLKVAEDLRLLDTLGLRDDVLFTGFIPDEDIPVLYNLADLLILPSFYEGFGIPVLEAMACGCPVVTTKTGCSPEVAGGAAILVDPHSPEEIAEAAQKVLSDGAVRADLVEKGLRRAQQFSWEKCARETLALFEETTTNTRSAA
jgi:glycosyltransferase involved in cell wall biosynthesis